MIRTQLRDLHGIDHRAVAEAEELLRQRSVALVRSQRRDA
jgi:hypothetical protein